MKIEIDVFEIKNNKYGIQISRKIKDGWMITYIGDWKGEFGTEDVFKLKGKYKQVKESMWMRFKNRIRRNKEDESNG